MEIPIVLIHKNDHPCLEYSIRAATQHHSDITLITDIKWKYDNAVKTVDIDLYACENTIQFSKVYQHFSSNNQDFEFICIERWFILLEHMKRNKLTELIYIDSDVIIYENLSEIILKHYKHYEICLSIYDQKYEDMRWVASGGHMYTTYKALEAFCQFILDTYTNNIKKLLLKWNWHLDNKIKGGINDMTFIYLFQHQTDFKIGNLLAVVDNEFCWDSHLYSSTNEVKDEYEMEHSCLLNNDIKKIKFKNNHPYCYNTIKQKDIRFVLLHFQSDAKRIMPKYIRSKFNLKWFITDKLKTAKLYYYAFRREVSNFKNKVIN